MITALNDYPNLPFTLVINPDSGPGSGSTPDSQYQDCLPTLRDTSNSNVLLVGYVHTSYGTRSTSDIEADVLTYSNWPPSYQPDGIFFDEVPTDLSYASTYASLIDYVNSLDWNSDPFVSAFSLRWSQILSTNECKTVLNPGTSVPDAYFDTGASLVITEEEAYDEFS
jgi:hypothetical protein